MAKVIKKASKPLELDQTPKPQNLGIGNPMADPFLAGVLGELPLVQNYGYGYGNGNGINPVYPFFNMWGAVSLNQYGTPWGYLQNFWLMDNNPTVALSQAVVDAPIKAAEGAFAVDKSVPKSMADEILAACNDYIGPIIRPQLTMMCQGQDDGFAVIKHAWEIDAQGFTYPESNFALNPFFSRAITDGSGRVVGVTNNGNDWDDIRQFTWVTYDPRYGAVYGRSRKLNYMKPWLDQEYLYDMLQTSMNIQLRPLPYVTYPYISLPPGATGQAASQARQQNKDALQNAKQITRGLMSGEGVTIPNPYASSADTMIKQGIDPKNVMPYTIGFFDPQSDHGAGLINALNQMDDKIVSGHLATPRTMLGTQKGGKADADAHTDSTTSTREIVLDYYAGILNNGVISTFISVNFGPEYVGKVKWEPAPLVDDQIAVSNTIVQEVFAGPQGFQNMLRALDIVALMEKTGVKLAADFDAQRLLDEDAQKEQEANAVKLQSQNDPPNAGMKELALSDGGSWVTIDGTHVLIGKGGTIEKGPKALVGKKPSEVGKVSASHGENHPETGTKDGLDPKREAIDKAKGISKKVNSLQTHKASTPEDHKLAAQAHHAASGALKMASKASGSTSEKNELDRQSKEHEARAKYHETSGGNSKPSPKSASPIQRAKDASDSLNKVDTSKAKTALEHFTVAQAHNAAGNTLRMAGDASKTVSERSDLHQKAGEHFAKAAHHQAMGTKKRFEFSLTDETPAERDGRRKKERAAALALALLAFWGSQRQDIATAASAGNLGPYLATQTPVWNTQLGQVLSANMVPAATESAHVAIAPLETTPEQAAKVTEQIKLLLDEQAEKQAMLINGTRVERIQKLLDAVKPEAENADEVIADGIDGVFDDLGGEERAQDIAEDLDHAAGQSGITAVNRTVDNTLLRWQTEEDDRVCPICAPLDGVTVEPGEPFAPGIYTPVVDSHAGCRCVILLVPRPDGWEKE